MPQVIQYLSIQQMILPEGWIEEPASPAPPQPSFSSPLHALRVFHPPASTPATRAESLSWYDPAQVSLTVYAPGPPANLGDELMLKLLTERPHRLTAKEISSLHYFSRQDFPPISSWQQMRTAVWNQRLVLLAEGTYAGYHEWIMLVDDRSDCRVPKLPPLEQGRFYSHEQRTYPDQYYTPAELERLLGVNQPEFVPAKIPGLILRLHEVSYKAPENAYPYFLPQVRQALRTIVWQEQVGQTRPATPHRPFSFLRRLLAKGR